MNFSAEGDKLASVSIAPDYMLTIWDWETEAMGLHSKAFGQDVWNVQFSLDDPRRLTTSGIGHIRFWKMAATFTGLKLQGYIGKFGKIDLSDIENFIELPDGKVVSGTESGSLLLWEGNFIKCRFVQVGGKSCHDGSVSYMSYDRREKCLISASLDGTIKWWDFNAIDTAEVDSDQTMDFELLPIAEYSLSQRSGDAAGVGIKSMIDGGFVDNKRTFVVIDTKGRAQTLTFSTPHNNAKQKSSGKRLVDIIIANREKEQKLAAIAAAAEDEGDLTAQTSIAQEREGDSQSVVEMPAEPSPVAVAVDAFNFNIENNVFESFHAGKVCAVDTSPSEHLAATCGVDGVVRIIDYHSRTVIATRSFLHAATSIRWCGSTLDPTAKSIIVGFADGSLRLLTLGRGLDGNMSLLRRMVMKPHNEAITDIAFSYSNKYVATAGKDGSVFFLRCRPLESDQSVAWDPIKFVSTNAMAANNANNNQVVYCHRLCWSPTESQILLTCSDHALREVDLTQMFDPDATVEDGEGLTFEISLPYRTIGSAIDAIPLKNGLLQRVKKAETAISTARTDAVTEHEDGTAAATTAAVVTASAPASPQKKGKDKDAAEEPVSVALKVHCAAYALNRFGGEYIASASLNNTQHMLCEASLNDNTHVVEHNMGLYSVEAKDFPITPVVSYLRYGWTKRYLVIGLSDGTVQIRPSEYLEVFAKVASHNASFAGVVDVSMSFDDRYIVSVGGDGVMVVHRVRLDLLTARAPGLFKDLDAGVYGEEKVKRPTAKQTEENEPKYLTFVSSIHPALDDEKLFPDIISIEEQELLDKPAYSPDEESKDLPANAYSIQDNRLKLEEDAKRAAADELKSRIRASIRALRKDYEKIVKENDAIPSSVRLTSTEMAVDSEFFELLRGAGTDLQEEVHRECAYQAEFNERRLQKIQERVMRGLLIEEMPLYAFDVDGFHKISGKASEKRSSVSMVYSLRSAALDPAVSKIIEQVRLEVRQQELRESQIRSNEIAQKRATEAMDEMKLRLAKKEDQLKSEGSGIIGNEKSTENVNAAQQAAVAAAGEELSAARLRLQRRKERKEELTRHLHNKPSENDDDERDIRAIKQAERSIGDYKLKCADDYEVPEEQRINATKKLRQMAMLEDSILSLRLRFNERFLALRKLKREIVYSIRRSNTRIQQIDHELRQEQLSTTLWQPVLDASEFPDEFEEITESELKLYIQSNKGVAWDKSLPPPPQVLLGDKLEIGPNKKTNNIEVTRKRRPIVPVAHDPSQLENFLSDEKLIDFTPERTDQPKHYEVNESLLASAQIETVNIEKQKRFDEIESKIPVLKFAKMLLNNRMQSVAQQQSNLQVKAVDRRKKALNFERLMTLKNIEDNIIAFREAVDELRVDRHQVLCDIKLAEFKLLTLFQEYKLLQTFEGRDNALHQKQLRCKGEESEITALGFENKAKLETKAEEIQHWNDKLAQITQEFKSMLPENHPYLETLTKIFKKKVKRNKVGEADNEDEEEDDGDNEDEDEEDDEEVEDICPPGCDQMLFEKILDLREKKLDTEEVCSEIQKSIDDLKKTADRLKQREKQIAKEALQTEQEVQQFQLQKQAALNQINVVVPLRAGQVYTFEQSGLLTGPTDKPTDVVDTSDSNVSELLNTANRQLVSHIAMTSHTLFSTRYVSIFHPLSLHVFYHVSMLISALAKLKTRIADLHGEIDGAKDDFRTLHKERTRLLKEKEFQEKETDNWRDRCRELQMLKFGREIDLDELEGACDRTKEKEIEAVLNEERERFDGESSKLLHDVHLARERYMAVSRHSFFFNNRQ